MEEPYSSETILRRRRPQSENSRRLHHSASESNHTNVNLHEVYRPQCNLDFMWCTQFLNYQPFIRNPNYIREPRTNQERERELWETDKINDTKNSPSVPCVHPPQQTHTRTKFDENPLCGYRRRNTRLEAHWNFPFWADTHETIITSVCEQLAREAEIMSADT